MRPDDGPPQPSLFSSELCLAARYEPARRWVMHLAVMRLSVMHFAVRHLAVRRRTLLLLASLVGSMLWTGGQVAFAQTQPDPRWMLFAQSKDGLISNDVTTMAVTDDAVWFGTGEGISRYDGVWTSFPHPPDAGDPTELGTYAPPGRVQVLVKSANHGELYAATDRGRIAAWRGDAWHDVVDVGFPVLSLLAIGPELWIGTDTGLLHYDGEQITQDPDLIDRPIYALIADGGSLLAGTDTGLWRNDGGGWRGMDVGDGPLAAGVTALLRDSAGNLWAGTRRGFAWQEPTTGTWQLHETPDDLDVPAPVQALAADDFGTIWAATDGAGAVSFDRASTAQTYGLAGDQNLTTRFVRAVAVDQDGSIWFATPAGAYRFQPSSWQNDVRGTGVDDLINHVNALLVDRAGNLWIATGGSGVRFRSAISDTETIYVDELGGQAAILALEEDNQGGIWAGSFDGVFRFEGGEWSVPVARDDLPSPVVTDLLAEGDGLWIGTDSGLVNYNLTTGVVTNIPAMGQQGVEALAIDTLGRLWIGTQQDGITIRSLDGKWTQLRHDPADPESLPADQVASSGLAPDLNSEGGMWALFVNGLMHWDGQRWLPGDPANELPSNLIWTIYSDPEDGSLWIGSEAGVTRFDGTTWGTLDAKDGLQSPIVYAVTRAPDGSYWFGGRRGLSHYRPEKSPPWIRIGSLVGTQPGQDGDAPQLELGQDLLANFEAGDLQTLPANLKVLYRLAGPAQSATWREAAPGFLRVSPEIAGDYLLEFWARDQSFNYSDKVTQEFSVVLPPPRVHIPLLGDVEQEVFQTLVILGAVALLGAAYVSMEIIQNRRRMREAVNRAYNPYISGEPIRRDDMFFGRADLVQRIVDTLHNNSIMIHGERRIGKTSLLYHLANVLREVNDSDYWFVPLYIDLEGTTQETFFHFLMEDIASGLYFQSSFGAEITAALDGLRYHSLVSHEYTDRDFNRDLREVIQALQDHGEDRYPDKQLRVILLMDEMDVVNNYDHLIQQQLRRIFMRDFASNLGAVVAGIQISKTWDRVESPWYNLFNEIELEPFTREQALELLTEPVRDYYVYDRAALEFIVDNSDGRPFRIQQFGLEAVNRMLADGRRRIRLEDAEAAHRVIQTNVNAHDQPAAAVSKDSATTSESAQTVAAGIDAQDLDASAPGSADDSLAGYQT